MPSLTIYYVNYHTVIAYSCLFQMAYQPKIRMAFTGHALYFINRAKYRTITLTYIVRIIIILARSL